MNREFIGSLERFGPVQRDIALSAQTSFRIGGIAEVVAHPQSESNLMDLITVLNQEGVPYKIWGNGSNILASDQPYHGVIVKLDRCLNAYNFNGTLCTAQAGTSLIALAYQAYQQGLSGLEFASGIPGSVGGAVYMNAGAYLSSLYDRIERVRVLRNGLCEWIPVAQIEHGYRFSSFNLHRDWIILAVELRLCEGDKTAIKTLMDTRQTRRLASQPLEFPSAGSVFRNPAETPAWQLIERAGLRGLRIGDAMISDKHANFIINLGHARAEDVRALIATAQARIAQETGIELKPEIEFFNFNNP